MRKMNIISSILILFIQPAISAVLDKQESGFNMVVQNGHSGWVRSISVSPDGKLIATGAGDKTIKIWAANGKLIKTITSADGARDVVFSPDGRHIASSGGKDIHIWTNDGKLVTTIAAKIAIAGGGSAKPVFSPDSKHIAGGAQDNILRLWSFDGKLVSTFKHPDFVTSASFSPDGKWIATGSSDRLIRIWDRSGKLVRHFEAGPQGRETAEFRHSVTAMFSPDGKRIASAFTEGTNRSSLVKLWTIKGKLIKTLEKGELETFSFSPDGKHLAVSLTGYAYSTEDQNARVTIWDSAGRMVNALKIAGKGAVYTPDGKHMAASFGNWFSGAVTNVNIWTLDGKLVKSFGKGFSGIWGVSLSPDGKYIVAGYKDETVKLWSIDGKLIRSSGEGADGLGSRVAFAPDGRYVIIMPYRGKALIKFRDITGSTASTVTVGEFALNDSIAFSADGKHMAIATSNNNDNACIKLLTMDGVVVHTFTGHSGKIRSMEFSPDGKHIVSGAWDGKIKVWDVKSGNVKTYEAGKVVTSVSVSPDGKFLVSAVRELPDGNSLAIKLWDINGNLLRKFSFKATGPHILNVRFSPDGKNLVSVFPDNSIIIWGLGGNYIKTLRGHTDSIANAFFTPDSKHIISGSSDGTIKVWNSETGNYLSMLASADGAEWISYTPDGYFDASRHGGELVAMVDGLNAYGVDQFAVRNNRPDLMLERIGVVTPEQITHYYFQYKKRLTRMGLTEAALSTELHIPDAKITSTKPDGKFITVSFSLSDDRYPLKRYNLYVNDIPYFGPYGKDISGKRYAGTEKVELTPGDNKIEVSVINEAGAESYRALTYADYDGKAKGDIYYLAFGVSKYKEVSLNLNYADKDVKDLQTTISRMRSAYDDVHIKTFLNNEVTAGNIRKAADFLKNSKVDDTVILFFAGHGAYDKNKDPKYYYLPYDADPANLTSTGVDFESIENILSDIKPRKKLFLLDTCESGELDEDVYARYYAMADARGFKPRTFRRPAKTRGETQVKRNSYLHEKDRFIYNNLARRSGAAVFSSSRGNEVSYESSSIQNGFFSREIINALTSEAADKNHDGKINIEELREYVGDAVAKDTAGLQNPTVDWDNIYQKIELPSLSSSSTKMTDDF